MKTIRWKSHINLNIEKAKNSFFLYYERQEIKQNYNVFKHKQI